MDKEYIARLIAKVGGPLLPNENPPRYIARVADKVGVGFSSMRAAYYGQPIGKNLLVSKPFLTKLERAARDAHHRDAAIISTKYFLSLWRTDPELHREEIDAACEFIDRLSEFDLQARRADGGEE